MKASRAQAKQALAMEDTTTRLDAVEEKLDQILELLQQLAAQKAPEKPAPKQKAKSGE